MTIPNPTILQFKNTFDVDILARINYYLKRGYVIKVADPTPSAKLSSYKDQSEKNKFIIEETLNFETMAIQSKIPLGHIILRAVGQQALGINEVEIFSRRNLPRECKADAFLIHLAIALCNDFTLVDPSNKIEFGEVPNIEEALKSLDDVPSQTAMEPKTNTELALGDTNDHRMNYFIGQTDSDSNLSIVEKHKSHPTLQIPNRPADIKKWRLLYKKIRGWHPHLSYNMISDKLHKDPAMKGYPISPDTIAKILTAGDLGMLNEE